MEKDLNKSRQLIPNRCTTYKHERRKEMEKQITPGLKYTFLVHGIMMTVFGFPLITETFGKVRISVNQNAPWAGLFPNNAVTKGAFIKFLGALTSKIVS